MSVYIKGLNLPKEGCTKIILCADGTVWGYSERPDNYDAIELPPHGRLGDLDAFESIKYELPDGQKAFNRGFHSGVQYVQRLIMDAPTIIPAEGGASDG